MDVRLEYGDMRITKPYDAHTMLERLQRDGWEIQSENSDGTITMIRPWPPRFADEPAIVDTHTAPQDRVTDEVGD